MRVAFFFCQYSPAPRFQHFRFFPSSTVIHPQSSILNLRPPPSGPPTVPNSQMPQHQRKLIS